MPRAHYHISEMTRHAENITAWLARNQGDCATTVSLDSSYLRHLLIKRWQDFLLRLKDHILGRFARLSFSGDEQSFSDEERSSVVFVNNRIYRHKVLQVNYMTYDMWRSQDSIPTLMPT